MDIERSNSASAVRWFYSYEVRGWFSPAYNIDIPADAVEVTDERRAELVAGSTQGMVVVAGTDGCPELADPPPPAIEQLVERERRWRDLQLQVSDPLVARHRDEREMESDTSISAEEYTDLLGFRAALRQWPESSAFPEPSGRPVAPTWLTEQIN